MTTLSVIGVRLLEGRVGSTLSQRAQLVPLAVRRTRNSHLTSRAAAEADPVVDNRTWVAGRDLGVDWFADPPQAARLSGSSAKTAHQWMRTSMRRRTCRFGSLRFCRIPGVATVR